MSHEDQLDIRDLGRGAFELSFPYNLDFINFIKAKVPYRDRSYAEATHIWTIWGEHYIGHLEGVGLQKFSHVTRVFHRGTDLVVRNVRTGTETVQKGLFA